MSVDITFASVLKDFRTRAGYSQDKLASELKVSFATVNRWENGKTVPDSATLHAVAEFVRRQGTDVSDVADRLERGGFAVPAGSRRGRRKQTDEEPAPGTVLDVKSMESLLWKAACSIRGEKDAPKFKDYILPLLFIKRLSDVFEDEVVTLIATYGSEALAREVLEADHTLVRFYIPPFATWPVISGRQTYDWPENEQPKTIGELLTTATRAIAAENKTLQGVIDIVDFNETRNGEREISDEALARIIELFSQPRYRLGLHNVEPDFLGRAYEYLLRKFAEGQGQSAGEFFTPKEVGWLIAYLVRPQQGEEVYDPTCGSAGLLVKCQLALVEQEKTAGRQLRKPLKLYGQELTGSSYAIGRMNMVLHDMEGEIARGNTMTTPKFLEGSNLKKFDIVVANPMWNQNNFATTVYEGDQYDRFSGGIPPESSADWGWLQHIAASLKDGGRAAIILDSGAVSRGSGNQGDSKEKAIRRWFVDQNLIDAAILLPENLFYNTAAAGIIILLRRGREENAPVVVINAEGEAQKGRPKNHLLPEALKRIADDYHDKRERAGAVRSVSRDLVRQKDYTLSAPVYVADELLQQRRDITIITQELQALPIGNSAVYIDGFDPSSWPRIPLRDALLKTQYGLSIRGERSGRYPILRMNCQKVGRVVFDDLQFVDLTDDVFDAYALADGDILFNRTNSYELVGRTALFSGNRPAVFASYLVRLIVNRELADPAFLNFYLNSAQVQRELKSLATRGVSQSNISASKLRDFHVSLPPLPLQRELGIKISNVRDTVDLNERRLKLTYELFEAAVGRLLPAVV